MAWMVERSAANDGRDPSGHALMASCPPPPFPSLTVENPFGAQLPNASVPTQQEQHLASSSLSSHPAPTAHRNYSRHGAPRPDALPSNTATTATDRSAGRSTPAACTAPTDPSSAPMQTRELSKANLHTLLNLSEQLPSANGEITPVAAWRMILSHPRLGQLDYDDLRELTEVLRGKIRCYGFGAVLEEFELRDALEHVFLVKPETA